MTTLAPEPENLIPVAPALPNAADGVVASRGPLSNWSVTRIPPTVSPAGFDFGTWFLGLAAVVVLGILFGGLVTGTNTALGGNSTVALAVITGTAVVIERLLEAFWNFEDSTKGGWWPLDQIHEQIDQRVRKFGDYIQPYLNQLEWAHRALEDAHAGDAGWKPKLDAIASDIQALPDQLTEFATKVQTAQLGNDQKLDILLNNAASQLTAVMNAHPDLQKQLDRKVDLAKALTDDIYEFAAAFKDNPARRIVSLVVGCAAGFVVALVLRLDLFSALGVEAFTPVALGGLKWGLGVPLTGLIMGLGSNPTHEVIQAIQQFKQSK
jgi:hypothetical protein